MNGGMKKHIPWYLEIHTFHHHILDVYTLWKYISHPNRTAYCNLRKRTNLRRTTWDSHNFRNDIVPPDISVYHMYVSWPNVVLQHRLMRGRERGGGWWIWKCVWSWFQRIYFSSQKLEFLTYYIQYKLSKFRFSVSPPKKKKTREHFDFHPSIPK